MRGANNLPHLYIYLCHAMTLVVVHVVPLALASRGGASSPGERFAVVRCGIPVSAKVAVPADPRTILVAIPLSLRCGTDLSYRRSECGCPPGSMALAPGAD